MNLRKIIKEVKSQPNLFKNKSELDHFVLPSDIIGREDKIKELVKLLLEPKLDYIPPVISIYGRSGTGKSCLTRKVCEELKKVERRFEYFYVNLRECKTVFGAINLVLQEFSEKKVPSALGLDSCFDRVHDSLRNRNELKSIVMIMDEFDSIVSDKRNSVSDFLYKFLIICENLRNIGINLCIITISNNVLTNYELDDRVKSRMGNVEIYFNPYSAKEILAIVKERALRAFFDGVVDDEVLSESAKSSEEEHGDARRAIDLLRFAGEFVISEKRNRITKEDLLKAKDMIQQDLLKAATAKIPYHSKVAIIALSNLAFLSKDGWIATSQIYNKYKGLVHEDFRALTYRRVSDILGGFEDLGLCISRTFSKGRHGYGKEYRLTIAPRMILETLDPDRIKALIENLANEKFLEDWRKMPPLKFGGLGKSRGSTGVKLLEDYMKEIEFSTQGL